MTSSLVVRRVQIRRAPGFPQGGPLVEKLDSGVSLILGPNESGKTTVARLLQGVLWPGELSRTFGNEAIGAEVLFELDGSRWRAVVDGTRVRWQKDGSDHPAGPVLPPAEAAGRYLISLHDLLAADDPGRALAAEIRRLAAGGIDFAAAAESLGVSAAGRPRTLVQEMRGARAELAEARTEAARILDAGEEVPALERRLRGLERQERLEPALDRLLALQEAGDELERVRAERDALPQGLALLRDGDAEALDDLDARAGRLATRQAELTRIIEEAAAARAAAGVGDPPPDDELLDRLGALDEVAHSESDAGRAARRRCESAAEGRRAAAAELGLPADLAPVGGFGDDLLGRVRRHLGQGVELEARIARLKGRLDSMGSRPDAPAPDRPDPRELLRLREVLQSWLAAEAADTPLPFPSTPLRLAAAVLATVGLGLVAAGLVRPPGPDALVAGGGLLVAAVAVGLALLRPPPRRDRRGELRNEAARLGLEHDDWSEDGVRARIAQLESASAAAEAARRDDERRRELAAQLDEALAEHATWRTTYAALAQELGLAPEADALTVERAGALLVAWDDAHRAWLQARAEVQAADDLVAEVLDEAGALLAPWAPPPSGPAELRAAVRSLVRRSAAHRDAVERSDRAHQELDAVRADLDDVAEQRRRMAGRLQVPESDLATTVAARAPRRVEWREAVTEVERAEARVEQVRREVRGAFEGEADLLAELVDERLRVRDRADVEGRLQEARAARAEAAQLRERIGRLRGALDDARRKHDVEAALTREARAVDEVAAWRDREREKAATRALIRWVRSRTEERDRPRVFARARRLLEVITRGRHTVELAPAEDGGFRTVHTTTGEGRSLAQLSSGTRVQLLLAVRLAFVEVQEGDGVSLPLLLDEVLGTSDDERARAVVEAATTLATRGRQVLYFTAQADEVRKWREAAGEATAPRLVTLGSVSEVSPAVSWPAGDRLTPAPPEPGGHSHAAYGRELGVPPVDLWAPDPVRSLHPWHLLDDPADVHRFLAAGLDAWGQIQALVRASDPAVPAPLRTARATMEPRADLCADLVELVRRGRGRPVDRAALAASGAVSDVFMERAVALLKRLDGDAGELLDAIERGELKGFRSDKAADLRDHLAQAGHLPDTAPLPPDEVLTRLHFRAQRLPAAPSRTTVSRWIRRWLRGPESPGPDV